MKKAFIIIMLCMTAKFTLAQKLETKIVRGAPVVYPCYLNALAFSRWSKQKIEEELLRIYSAENSGVDDNFAHYYATTGMKDGVHAVYVLKNGAIMISWTDFSNKPVSIMEEDMDAIKANYWKYDPEDKEFVYQFADPIEAGADRHVYTFRFKREGGFEMCTITFKLIGERK